MRSRRTNGDRGFTLIELLATMMIASLLMTTVLGVIGSMALQRRSLERERIGYSWRGFLLDQFRWDLLNSKRIEFENGQLTLIGYHGIDPVSGSPNHLLSEVVYSIASSEGRSWLFRRHINLHELTNENVRTDLVCADVVQLEVTKFPEDSDEPLGELVGVPDKLRLTVHFSDPAHPPIDRVFHLK